MKYSQITNPSLLEGKVIQTAKVIDHDELVLVCEDGSYLSARASLIYEDLYIDCEAAVDLNDRENNYNLLYKLGLIDHTEYTKLELKETSKFKVQTRENKMEQYLSLKTELGL